MGLRGALAVLLCFFVAVMPVGESTSYAPVVDAVPGERVSTRPLNLQINVDRVYSVGLLYDHLGKLAEAYPHLKVDRLANSTFGSPIYAVVLGSGPQTVMITAGMHGWEWVTSYLVMRELAALLYQQATGVPEAVRVLADYRLVFLPLVNPDGMRIAQGERRPLVGDFWGLDIRDWKANAWGVDINRNFPHGFAEMSRHLPRTPGPEFHPGRAPASERETQAVMLAIATYKPDILYDFHSSGNVIFWHYNQTEHLERDRSLARRVAGALGFAVSDDLDMAIGAHLKDYFIGTYKRPAFIVEIGTFQNRHQIHLELTDLYRRFANFTWRLAPLTPESP